MVKRKDFVIWIQTGTKSAGHLPLYCQFYITQRLERFENLEKVEPNFVNLQIINFFFYCMFLKPAIPKVSIKKLLKM